MFFFGGGYDRSDLADFKQFQNRIFRFLSIFPGRVAKRSGQKSGIF